MHWSHRRFVWSHFRRSVLHRVWALQERKFGCNMDLIWCSTCAILLTTSAVSQPCKLTYNCFIWFSFEKFTIGSLTLYLVWFSSYKLKVSQTL